MHPSPDIIMGAGVDEIRELPRHCFDIRQKVLLPVVTIQPKPRM